MTAVTVETLPSHRTAVSIRTGTAPTSLDEVARLLDAVVLVQSIDGLQPTDIVGEGSFYLRGGEADCGLDGNVEVDPVLDPHSKAVSQHEAGLGGRLTVDVADHLLWSDRLAVDSTAGNAVTQYVPDNGLALKAAE